ncbi:MAG TPA: methyltransferase domain-containing protein [Chloroflexia bacterium]|nr:methyltransferase domain-containing protein [Chloroflexia bacterium]
MDKQNRSDAAAWNERYDKGQTGWDIGEPAPPFVDYVENGSLLNFAPEKSSLLVPGCGRGHDALYFAQQGFEVTALDFAPTAIAEGIERARKTPLRGSIQFAVADFFQLPEKYHGKFDYAAEHTLFCAIEPSLRPQYARVMHQVLKPGGLLLAIFWAHHRAGGPPYSTTPAEIQELFTPYFEIEHLELAARSHLRRANEEFFGVLRKKD